MLNICITSDMFAELLTGLFVMSIIKHMHLINVRSCTRQISLLILFLILVSLFVFSGMAWNQDGIRLVHFLSYHLAIAVLDFQTHKKHRKRK